MSDPPRWSERRPTVEVLPLDLGSGLLLEFDCDLLTPGFHVTARITLGRRTFVVELDMSAEEAIQLGKSAEKLADFLTRPRPWDKYAAEYLPQNPARDEREVERLFEAMDRLGIPVPVDDGDTVPTDTRIATEYQHIRRHKKPEP